MLERIGSTVSVLLFVCGVMPARASEPVKEREVELFAAMESGEIEAEVIAPSARQIFLKVNNKSTEQLRIQLPKAFAAVPVLAQLQPGFPGGGIGGPGFGAGFGGPGFGAGLGQGGNQPGMGGSQGLGGGFNGGGQGNQFGIGQGNQFGNQIGNQFGNQFGRGVFRVPAGKVGKIAAQTFCLEHGKPDPTSKKKYRIVPLEQFVGSDSRISDLCHLLANGSISQNVAQAAAWNMANGLPFEQLATINRVQSRYTGNVKMFNDEELTAALNVVEKLTQKSTGYVVTQTRSASAQP